MNIKKMKQEFRAYGREYRQQTKLNGENGNVDNNKIKFSQYRISLKGDFHKANLMDLMHTGNVKQVIEILSEILMPTFQPDVDGLAFVKKLKQAIKEIQDLQDGFVRLKLDPDGPGMNTLLSPALRRSVYKKWLQKPLMPFRISDGVYSTKGFSLNEVTQFNFFQFDKPTNQQEQKKVGQWYTKFLADAYLHWFLSNQSIEVVKGMLSQEATHTPNGTNGGVWPGAYSILQDNKWEISYNLIDANRKYEKTRGRPYGIQNWNDPRLDKTLHLPGLEATSVFDEDTQKVTWIIPNRMTIRTQGVLSAWNKTVKLAFRSLENATMIRIPNYMIQKEMMPTRPYPHVRNRPQTLPKVIIEFEGRPPMPLLFDPITVISFYDRPSVTKWQFWLGMPSNSHGLELTLSNIRLIEEDMSLERFSYLMQINSAGVNVNNIFLRLHWVSVLRKVKQKEWKVWLDLIVTQNIQHPGSLIMHTKHLREVISNGRIKVFDLEKMNGKDELLIENFHLISPSTTTDARILKKYYA